RPSPGRRSGRRGGRRARAAGSGPRDPAPGPTPCGARSSSRREYGGRTRSNTAATFPKLSPSSVTPGPLEVRAHVEGVVAVWQQRGQLGKHLVAVVPVRDPADRRREGEHLVAARGVLVVDLAHLHLPEPL